MKTFKKLTQKPLQITRAFSLVELVLVIVIIAVLSGVAILGVRQATVKANNSKMLDDLVAIANAMEQYKQDMGTYPLPEPGGSQNILCYFADATYAHDCDDPEVAFRQGMIDNQLLGKKILNKVPTDPRTGSRYMYGVSNNGQFFQVAGLFEAGEDLWEARIQGNVSKGFSLPSVIRAFDGPNFVVQRGTFLPYDPGHLVLSATARQVEGDVTVGARKIVEGDVLNEGDELQTGVASSVNLYFSDGSVSTVEERTKLTLEELLVEENSGESTITKIKVLLLKGKLWNKVVRLSQKSEFNVEATGAIAGVRGTEFGVEVARGKDTITVKSGTVDVKDKAHGKVLGSIEDVTPGSPVQLVVSAGNPGQIIPATTKQMTWIKAQDNTLLLNNNLVPRIVQVEDNTVIVENLYVTLGKDPSEVEIGVSRLRVRHEEGEFQMTNIADYKNNGENYIIQMPQAMKAMQLRFEGLSGFNVTQESTWSAWSQPPVNVGSGVKLTEEALLPENAQPKPTLKIEQGKTVVVAADEDGADFNLNVELKHIDLNEQDVIYTVQDENNLCSGPNGSLTENPQQIPLTVSLSGAKEAECEVKIQVKFGGQTLQKETKVKVKKESDTLNKAQLGYLPELELDTLIHQADDILVVKYKVKLNGHGFDTLTLTDGDDTVLEDNLTHNENEQSITIPLSANFTQGEENTVKLVLNYNPYDTDAQSIDSANPQEVEREDTFFYGKETILFFDFVDPDSSLPYSDIPKVNLGDAMNLKVMVLKTTAGESSVIITPDCSFTSSNGGNFGGGLFVPAEEGMATLTCTLQKDKELQGKVLTNENLLSMDLKVEVEAPSITLADVCVGENSIYYSSGELQGCWTQAEVGKSCSYACSLLSQDTLTVACVGENNPANATWNDNAQCEVCGDLNEEIAVEEAGKCSDDASEGAPFSIGTFFCRYRNESAVSTQDCGAAPEGRSRICKCE